MKCILSYKPCQYHLPVRCGVSQTGKMQTSTTLTEGGYEKHYINHVKSQIVSMFPLILNKLLVDTRQYQNGSGRLLTSGFEAHTAICDR